MSRPSSAQHIDESAIAGPSHLQDVSWQHVNQTPKGRMVYPLPGQQPGIISVAPPSAHSEDGEFLPMEGSEYGYLPDTTPYMPFPSSTPIPPSTSPTMMIANHHSYPGHSPTDAFFPAPASQFYVGPPPPRRPGMQHRHTTHAGSSRPAINRSYSLQPPRIPNQVGHDVFAVPGSTPIRRPEYDTCPQPLGISPARALGPAPPLQPHFSPHRDPLATPHTKGYPMHVHSSASSSTVMTETSMSSNMSSSGRRRAPSTDEDDSPTKGPKVHQMVEELPPRLPQPVRLMKPTTIIGGRTSARFAKVAEDPGVEGVPPGPRPIERPTPSFACIIGQAILHASAGGLSLEHIYRYVETMYPYFKSGDGAWRNSVRHNLSIHKMFETIPRTDKFPPGKGGIWIIHEEEKCHWQGEDKFTKNFPASHPHHSNCRQTLHERQKEMDAIAKAKAEGREYVPKKGKKAKKPLEEDTDMIRTHSAISDAPSQESIPLRPVLMPPPVQPRSITPVPIVHPPPHDDDLFEPILEDAPPKGTMVPPRFGIKRPIEGDEENVFTAPKRVRVAEPSPLAPIPHPQQQLDDAYVTPERERQMAKMTSAFKTPALVNTSSSPGSSPMPVTAPRTINHHPSALQQAWTHDDMSTSSSPNFSLDAAFDIKPKLTGSRRLDDDFAIPHSPRGPPKTPLTRSSAATDRTPRINAHRTPFAKTPMMFHGSPMLPRPSGHEMSTPAWEMEGILDRLKDASGLGGMAPMMSPIRSPSRISGAFAIPLGLRSPLTSTDPSRYATLMSSGDSDGGSPTKRSPTSISSLGEGISAIKELGRAEGERTRSGEMTA